MQMWDCHAVYKSTVLQVTAVGHRERPRRTMFPSRSVSVCVEEWF